MAKDPIDVGVTALIRWLESNADSTNSWTSTSYIEELARTLNKGESTIKRYLGVLTSLKIVQIQELKNKATLGRRHRITVLKPGVEVEKGPVFFQIKTS